MKISLNWLRDFVDVPAGVDPKALGDLFTIRTAEVEAVENQGSNFDKMVIGQIQEIHPHPDADKLRVTKTSVGKETLQIVCGAPNIYEGMYVAVALPGAQVRWHGEGDLITLEPAKIRGVESFGMICAGDEIGLDPSPEGVTDFSALKPKTGAPLASVLAKNDVIFHIDNKSLTHRPDLWGHYGIAREVAAITGAKLKPFKTTVKFPAKGESPDIAVKSAKLCPRYTGVLIDGIKVGPSPEWMQSRLTAAGYRPINNIVDITNYVMAELGQPLHAFDAAKIDRGIVVRTAKAGEEIETLDGDKHKLDENMLVIADHKKAVAIAGVMGGANSEVDDSTAKILVESANFNPSSVRKTSVKLGLRTEAVQRFEKSLDPQLAGLAIDRVCELVLQICPGAKICGPKTDIVNFSDKRAAITIDLAKVFSKIGKTIPEAEVLGILRKLEFKAVKAPGNKLKIEVPSFRPLKDIEIEDDLVEEIARLHGYENIKPLLPELPTKLPLENYERKLKHHSRKILSYGLGFSEVYNYSFYSIADIRKCLLPEELHEKMINFLSEDQTHLRVSLLPNMLKNVVLNLKYRDSFKIYEIGRTYQDLQEYFPIEEKKICGLIVQPKKADGEPFYEAKGALESYVSQLRVPGIEMKKGTAFCSYAHPNKYAGWYFKKNGQEIGRVYEVHPLVLKNYDLEKVKVAAFEINFTAVAAAQKSDIKYKPLPKFPEIEIDVSVLIDKKTEVGKLLKLISEADRKLIREVKLFDIYEGANIPEGKKSLAFKATLRSDERTLTDAEMKQVQQEIFSRLKQSGGEIRGQ